MGAVMCISCETPGGCTDILRSWWAKTGITLIVKWWWVCCASLDDSCRNDCVMSIMFLNFHGALSLVDPLWDPRVSNHISLLGELKGLQTASQVKHFNSPTDTCELGFGAQSRMGFQTIFPSRGIWALHRWYWKFALQGENKSPHWNFMAIIEFPQSTDPLLPH